MRVLMLFAIILLNACNHKVEFKPRAIDHENDLCAKCQMQVVEDKYVVQSMNSKGDVKFFDDFGCFVKYEQGPLWNRYAGSSVPHTWITDAETGEWLNIEQAFFRYGDVSPMNFGFGALKKEFPGAMSFSKAKQSIIDSKFSKKPEKSADQDSLNQEVKSTDTGKCGAGKCGQGKCG